MVEIQIIYNFFLFKAVETHVISNFFILNHDFFLLKAVEIQVISISFSLENHWNPSDLEIISIVNIINFLYDV